MNIVQTRGPRAFLNTIPADVQVGQTPTISGTKIHVLAKKSFNQWSVLALSYENNGDNGRQANRVVALYRDGQFAAASVWIFSGSLTTQSTEWSVKEQFTHCLTTATPSFLGTKPIPQHEKEAQNYLEQVHFKQRVTSDEMLINIVNTSPSNV
jgi:hypothetical protein